MNLRTRGEGSKNPKIMQMSFMYGPFPRSAVVVECVIRMHEGKRVAIAVISHILLGSEVFFFPHLHIFKAMSIFLGRQLVTPVFHLLMVGSPPAVGVGGGFV